MLLTEMKLGKPLEIFLLRGDYKFRLVSKIEDVRKGRVCVTLITSKNRVFQFHDSDKISFVYKDENKLFQWNGVIGGTTELDGFQVHCFYTDQPGLSFNRRNAYRVFIGEDIKLRYIVDKGDESGKKKTEPVKNEADTQEEESQFEEIVCDGFLKDLSESGAGIFSDERFVLKDEISFLVHSEFGDLKCKAEVVRISQESHGIYRRYYGCYFTESDRNLIKYLFKLQRQQLMNARSEDLR